jgi:ATP-dependent Lhr-like helicase
VTPAGSDPLAGFHPAVAEWFLRKYPAGPTEAQAQGWRAVAAGRDTLIAAPTGSGKTLAAFLVAIDRCYRAALWGEGRRGTDVVYVSPLRALTVDVAENLVQPLAEIAEVARELGYAVPDVRVAVRNGDTPQSERAAMIRDRPEIVVTTPESLYLLLTSVRGRELLASVRTVIVDEIHALARDKRGSHLALSLERLDELVRVHRVRVAAQEPATLAAVDVGGAQPAIGANTAVPLAAAPELGVPVRIGLSATQRPISTIARLLVGAGADRVNRDGSPRCQIVDVGHRRALDIAIELPDDELGAVSTHEQLAAVLEQIADHVRQRRTTLVFVNTRRMAERVAHRLGELVGDDLVQAHHGSLSMERRLRVESRLRAGDLKAVVATASLELGIDVGPVELVCQLGSPRAIATWLQRVGRAQHHVGGTPVGRLYPLTRDELVECAALFAAVRRGELDVTRLPVAPLDILAQQIVAEVAAAGPDGIAEDTLYEVVCRAAPYSALDRASFDEVVELVSTGVVTGRGRRGAHVHRDGVNGVLRPRRGARLTATTSGGAIPEVADYRVVLEPEETFVGTVNEDWAIESMAGDVFLLGSHTWRIRRIESGTVRVVDANGASPSVPFWLGEAPARTDELSQSVSLLREEIEHWLGKSVGAAVEWLKEAAGLDARSAEQIVAYLATAKTELGALPTAGRLVVERFFDDTGGMQLVLHSPRGARLNRGLGLALRKRFCRSFDFELQAAASDDAVVLSLGPQNSFPLADIVNYLSPAMVRETLVQAVLPTPIFGARWRWNLSRSLISPRFRGTRHLPPAIQRMEADDLMAAIFPMLAACQENVAGPIEIPDHPIVRQTLDDCCSEAIDLAGLITFLEALRAGDIETRCVDGVAPSILSEEILNGRPYTFLDDAPLEERRARSVQLRRGVPLAASDLGWLDPGVVAAVAQQARAELRDAEELHELLDSVVIAEREPEWTAWFERLVADGRAAAVQLPGGGPAAGEIAGAGAGTLGAPGDVRWVAIERLAAVAELIPGLRRLGNRPAGEAEMGGDARSAGDSPAAGDDARSAGDSPAAGGDARSAGDSPAAGDARPVSKAGGTGGAELVERTLVDAVRGHLEVSEPLTVDDLAERAGIGLGRVAEIRTALARLEAEGSVLQCHVGDDPKDRYSARHLVMRIHAAMRDRSRRSIDAVPAQQLMRFLVAWQHAGPGYRLVGAGGLAEVIEQLQGTEAAVEAWESSILPARVAGYQAALLDELCGRGEVGFGRLALRNGELSPTPAGTDPSGAPGKRPGATPSPATPLGLFRREDLPWLLAAVRAGAAPEMPQVGAPADVIAALGERGALFLTDLCSVTGRMPIEVADALWDGIARGLVTADGFQAVRALLSSRARLPSFVTQGAMGAPAGGRPGGRGLPRPGRPRPRVRPALTGGRWSLLDPVAGVPSVGAASSRSAAEAIGFDVDELAEAMAGQLLLRWGVVFRDLVVRELIGIGWREVLWALRRLEARGVIRGGRFVSGFTGEQFALPEAYDQLRSIARSPAEGHVVRLSASDPLNLTGVILPGPRIPAIRTRTITITDGAVTDDAPAVRPAARSV